MKYTGLFLIALLILLCLKPVHSLQGETYEVQRNEGVFSNFISAQP